MVFAVDSLFLPHTTMALNKSADCIEICKRARVGSWIKPQQRRARSVCIVGRRTKSERGRALIVSLILSANSTLSRQIADEMYLWNHMLPRTHMHTHVNVSPAFLSPSEREMPIKYSQPACNFPQQQLVIFVAVRAALEEFLIPPAQVPERVEESHG